MIFENTRNIKNGTYSTRIKFVDYGKRDSVGGIDLDLAEAEQRMFDDFGIPNIPVGGLFKGQIKNYSVKDTEDEISFFVSRKSTPLNTKFDIYYATEKENYEILPEGCTPAEIAEIKCKIYEEEIIKRIKEAIEKLSQNTKGNFEEDNLGEFSILMEEQ